MHAETKPTVFEHDHPAPSAAGGATLIFLILAGLTLIALLIGFAELGQIKVWASLGVAVVQAIVLSLFFMDLKHGDKQTWLIAAASLFWTFLLFLFVLTDFLTRHFYAY